MRAGAPGACERGAAWVRARVAARPDYGRSEPGWSEERGYFTAEVPGSRLWFSSDRHLSRAGTDLHASFVLSEGDSAAFALRYAGEPPSPISVARAEELLEITRCSWRAWSSRCKYEGSGVNACSAAPRS